MIDLLYKSLGELIVYGGGAVALAYAVFRTLSVKWLDTKFEERLAAYKHAQARELEDVRFRINAIFDRLTKLNQREFEVLPEAWSRLSEGYWKTMSFVSPMQSYPDLDRMTERHLKEFIDSCELQAWEKDELWVAKDKNEYYRKHVFWHNLDKAQTAVRESHIYLQKNGIFLKPEIKGQFERLDDLVWNAVIAREAEERYGGLVPNGVTPVDRYEQKGRLFENNWRPVSGRDCTNKWAVQPRRWTVNVRSVWSRLRRGSNNEETHSWFSTTSPIRLLTTISRGCHLSARDGHQVRSYREL